MRRRDPEATKLRIIEAALHSFLQKGFAKTTMDDIVALSGVSKGGIYWHFKGKEEIFLYLLRQWMEDTYAVFQQVREEEGSTEEKLRKLIEHAYNNPAQPILSLGTEFWLSNLGNPELILSMQEIYGRYQEMFRDLLFDGMVRGEFETFDIEELTISFMGLIEGTVSYQILMGNQFPSNQSLMTGFQLFLRGIRKERKEELSC